MEIGKFESFSMAEVPNEEQETDSGIMHCSICLSRLDENIQSCIACSASFHQPCLKRWLGYSPLRACPACNANSMRTVRNRTAETMFCQLEKSHITKCKYCHAGLGPVKLDDGVCLRVVAEVLEYHYQNCKFYIQCKYEKFSATAMFLQELNHPDVSHKAVVLEFPKKMMSKRLIFTVLHRKTTKKIRVEVLFRRHKTKKTEYLLTCKLVEPSSALTYPVRFGLTIEEKSGVFSKIMVFQEQNSFCKIGTRTYELPSEMRAWAILF
jgi:Ring finger domain